MHRLVPLAAVAAVAMSAGLFVAHGANEKPQPKPADAAPTAAIAAAQATPVVTPPGSMVGRTVRVYFRGTDKISFPSESGSPISVASTLSYLRGKVVQVHPGWIELANKDAPGTPGVWIPAASAAYVMVDEDQPAAEKKP